jgi:polyribonucleotide nucleotidyltransferase
MVCELKHKKMQEKRFSKTINGKELIVETGSFAKQANGTVTVQCGDTVIMANATMSKNQATGIDYFPLMVEYEEKFYASGKIHGSRFIKREGRPSDEAVLTSRLIDRTIRPLFNQTMRNEVQVITTVLSYDEESDPADLAVIAGSLALGISDIPWNGPVAAVKIKKNPSNPEIPVNFLVAGTEDKINMIEADANECPEKDVQEIFEKAQKQIQEIVVFEKEIIAEIGKAKQVVETVEPEKDFIQKITALLDKNEAIKSLYAPNKEEQSTKKQEIKDILGDYLKENFGGDEDIFKKRQKEAFLILDQYLDELFHQKVLNDNQRPDGRELDEVRTISCQVGLLPRTHGSAVFNRGETQALTVVTLGSPGAEQLIDTMERESKKGYMHHYNFPPYCVGEVRFLRGPGRREIGHGALAEKALVPVLPSKEDFPYTIRVVSEILSSNGSSSMAATCGSTLSLMSAGVPIKKPVAGLAMGIVTKENSVYKILSDIQGPEDHWGDMDFKIAGTKDGITAIQLDVKIDGINLSITEEVLKQSKKNRLGILEKMTAVIAEPSKELSPFAPFVRTIKIKPEQIGIVIGPGGKIINKIIDEFEVDIDIDDDGQVFITANNQENGKKAEEKIKTLTREVAVGEIFEGKVVRVLDFGVFVELIPGKDGLLHISQIAKERVEDISKYLKVGDIIKVKVKEIDKQDRVNLQRVEK